MPIATDAHVAKDKRRYILLVTLAVLGITLSILAFIVVLGFERDRHQKDFEFKAASRISALQSEITSNVDAVHSLQSLYSASESVSRKDFGAFVRNEFTTHPAIQALEWIPRVMAEDRENFEASIRDEWFRDFTISERQFGDSLTTASERAEYFPVAYIEPYFGHEGTLGFDLASNPSSYEALKQSGDRGEPIATQRIVLGREVENQFGFLVFVPIYEKGSEPSSVQQRRNSLSGFALGVFRINDLVTSAWQEASLKPLPDDFQLSLVDQSAPEEIQFLLSSGLGQDSSANNSGELAFAGSISIGGRRWEATINSSHRSILGLWQPWSALLAGLSLTMVAVAYVLLAMQRESETKLLVDQRTKELSETNQRLANEILDRSKAQLELAGLYDISRMFSAEGDFQTKATDALEKVAVLASADWVTLRLPKPMEPGLHLVAAAGPSVEEYPPIPVFTEGNPISIRAFTEGIIEVIDDYGARPTSSQSSVDLGMRSVVVLPIKSGERTLGLVNVVSKDKDHFSPDLVHLLASVGEGLGVLLENSLLQEATEKSHRTQLRLANENAMIAEVGRVLGSSISINDGYGILAQKIHELVPFDRLDITVIDPTREYDEVVYSTEPSDILQGSTPMIGSITERVTTNLSGLIIQDMPSGEVRSEYSCLVSSVDEGQRSWLVVPLIHRGVGIGALFLASGKESAFSQEDLDLIPRFGRLLAGAISSARHQSQQAQAEEALREREARLRGIVESAIDGIITIDEVGTVESFNSGAEKIFGYSATEVVSQNVSMLMPAPHLAAHDEYLSTYKRTGVKTVIGNGSEVIGLRKDGTEFPMDLSVSVVELANRNIYTGIIRDVTEGKALQREIEQRAKELEIAYSELKTLDRMKDEFIATVSHELRTPLTSIKGAAEILLNYQDEDRATQTEFLTIIDNESDRLTRLINDVLDLARMESGETIWDISPVSLRNIIETAMDSTHVLTRNKEVTVEVAAADELPTVKADSDKLVQVVTNLLSNAIKFTPIGGSISVQSRLVPDADSVTGIKMVEVSVADTGIGIPSSEVHKIFNRFQQAGSTLSNRPQGTGLGLAISKEIITHLGGEIWVKSELGNGSTFFFTVPSVSTTV